MTESEKDAVRQAIAVAKAAFDLDGVALNCLMGMTSSHARILVMAAQTLIDTQPTMREFQREVKQK